MTHRLRTTVLPSIQFDYIIPFASYLVWAFKFLCIGFTIMQIKILWLETICSDLSASLFTYSAWPRLSWNSLALNSERSPCLCLLNDGIKGVCHHSLPPTLVGVVFCSWRSSCLYVSHSYPIECLLMAFGVQWCAAISFSCFLLLVGLVNTLFTWEPLLASCCLTNEMHTCRC